MKLQKWAIEAILWPAMERRKGNRIRSIQRELDRSQTESPAELQQRRLTELLLHCREHVPAYAGLLPEPEEIQADPFAVLRALPLLSKRAFQEYPERYLADNFPSSARIANHTGGSTGQPIHFFMTRPQVEAYEAARWRGLGWYGVTQGSRSVMIWGSPIELSRQAQLKNRLREELLEQVFHCPVANEYGARDAGILAYSCPEGGLHLTAENCLIEVLDPVTHAPLPMGESGVLAVTDLTNLCQPRLRYLLGDIGALSADLCACGRALLLMLHVQGREDDLLLGHDGTLVHGVILGQLLRGIPGIREFQFRQHSPQSATLLLVNDASVDSDTDRWILDQLCKVLPDTRVQIQHMEAIAAMASGKRRYAIREFPLPTAAEGAAGSKLSSH